MKSDKSTVLKRIDHISSMLINGHSRDNIVRYCSEKWRIKERQSDKYIAKARALITESIKREVNYDYSKAIRRYEELYKLTIQNKDYRTALSINKEITNLQGLLKTQVEHSGSVQFISNIPD